MRLAHDSSTSSQDALGYDSIFVGDVSIKDFRPVAHGNALQADVILQDDGEAGQLAILSGLGVHHFGTPRPRVVGIIFIFGLP